MAIIPQPLLDRMTSRDLSVITHVVIHHTASSEQDQDIADIALEEERDQGFVWCGYNFVIHGTGKHDGLIQVGRPISKVPAAQLGMNTVGVAISFEGNFHPPDKGYTGEKPSDSQIHSAITIINEWVKPKCPNLRYIIGHRDVARLMGNNSNYATACPGDLLQARINEIAVATKLKKV